MQPRAIRLIKDMIAIGLMCYLGSLLGCEQPKGGSDTSVVDIGIENPQVQARVDPVTNEGGVVDHRLPLPPPPLLATKITSDGGIIASVSASEGGILVASGAASADPVFAKTTLVIPAGALAGDSEIELAKGEDFLVPAMATSVGVGELSTAGPAVVLTGDDATIVAPLTLTLALKQGFSFALIDQEVIVVGIYKDKDDNSIMEVFPSADLRIDGGSVSVQVRRFGAYQTAFVDRQPPRQTLATTIVPVKTATMKKENWTAFYVADVSKLPACDVEREGQLYYIASTQTFSTCSNSSWTTVNLQGATGAQGPVGATGAQGPVGATGAQGPVGGSGVAVPTAPVVMTELTTVRIDGVLTTRSISKNYESIGGPLLWTCYDDSWSKSIIGGNFFYRKSHGDSQCLQSLSRSLICYFDLSPSATGDSCLAQCSSSRPDLCSNETMCNARGLIWADNSCGVCSDYNLKYCTHQNDCEVLGMTWANGQCLGPCAEHNLNACNSQSRCEYSLMTWADGQCLGRCSEAHLNFCTTFANCEGNGLTWSDGQCIGRCSEENLVACTSQYRCENNEMTWVNGQCHGRCWPGNLAACISQNVCENYGMTWANGQCLGHCREENLAACNSQERCENNGPWGMTWADGQCLGQCGQGNLAACTTQVRCEDSGMIWANAQCVAACSSNNLAACDTQSRCDATSGLYWANDNTCKVGSCWWDNLAACNTLEKCLNHSRASNVAWNDGRCQTRCPTGKVSSSRGCEVPVSCPLDQKVVDNSCQDIPFQVLTGNLCGEYASDVKITSGVHNVICDVSFSGRVWIEPGAILRAIGDVSWATNQDTWPELNAITKSMIALGTAADRITFDAAADSSWTQIKIGPYQDYSFLSYESIGSNFLSLVQPRIAQESLDASYGAGNKLSYVDFNSVDRLSVRGFSEHLTLADVAQVDFRGYLGFSQIDASEMMTYAVLDQVVANITTNRYIAGTTAGRLQIHSQIVRNSQFSAYVISSGVHDSEQILIKSGLSATSSITLTKSRIVSSTLSSPSLTMSTSTLALSAFLPGGNIYCSNASRLLGNLITGNINGDCGDLGSNSPDAVDGGYFALIARTLSDGRMNWSTTSTLNLNVPMQFAVYIFDKNGIVNDQMPRWSLTDRVNSHASVTPSPTGLRPTIQLGEIGQYRLTIADLDGVTPVPLLTPAIHNFSVVQSSSAWPLPEADRADSGYVTFAACIDGSHELRLQDGKLQVSVRPTNYSFRNVGTHESCKDPYFDPDGRYYLGNQSYALTETPSLNASSFNGYQVLQQGHGNISLTSDGHLWLDDSQYSDAVLFVIRIPLASPPTQ